LILPASRPSRAEAISALDPDLVGYALDVATEEPDRFMWAWEAVGTSAATGILDDVTYDWLTVVGPMLGSGGWPVPVGESAIHHAHEIGTSLTGIDASPTGTAGMAGLLEPSTVEQIAAEDSVVLLFTGVAR
jgi:threonine synthase